MVNGHGGNTGIVDVLAATLGHRHAGKARIVGLTYFALAADEIAAIRESGPGGMGHACEYETSMMLHLRPDLVEPERAVVHYPDPGSTYLSTDLLRPGRVRTYLDFADLSPSGTLGDPSLADAGKGARFFTATVASLVRFLDDFAGWPTGIDVP
jgi:creatinine amidohydrolase